MQSGCLEQLIWIDIHCGDDIFWQRQFIECFAQESAEAHDGFTTEQDVEPKLALQFFQRRRCGVAECEFRTERLF